MVRVSRPKSVLQKAACQLEIAPLVSEFAANSRSPNVGPASTKIAHTSPMKGFQVLSNPLQIASTTCKIRDLLFANYVWISWFLTWKNPREFVTMGWLLMDRPVGIQDSFAVNLPVSMFTSKPVVLGLQRPWLLMLVMMILLGESKLLILNAIICKGT